MAQIFLKENDPWRARTLFDEVSAKGLQKNSRLYATMIGCTANESSNAIDVDRAERFFREAIDAAKNRNKAFIDSMENKALSKEEEMCLLFSSDPSLESVYHSMIRVYSRAGYIDDVVILFGSLEKYLHLLGKLPSTYSYDVLIHGLGRHKRFDEARAYWEDLTNRSTIMPGARLYSTMMRVLVESGDPVSAVLLAGEMSARALSHPFIPAL